LESNEKERRNKKNIFFIMKIIPTKIKYSVDIKPKFKLEIHD
jgi:hypothetical protein